MTDMELIKKYEAIYGEGSFAEVFDSNVKELKSTMEELQSIIDELKERAEATQTSSEPDASNEFPNFEAAIIEVFRELGYGATIKDLSTNEANIYVDEDGYPTIHAEVTVELLLKAKIHMTAIHHSRWDIYIDEVEEFI